MFQKNINQVPKVMRSLQASEKQNAQQLQNLVGQVPDLATRQQLQSLQRKELHGSQQLNQMKSTLNNTSQSGMGIKKSNFSGPMDSLGKYHQNVQSSAGTRGLGLSAGLEQYSGVSQTLGGLDRQTQSNHGVNNKQMTFGVGHLMDKR